jgi:predicted phosphate transport protein (TIGR00153 family)
VETGQLLRWFERRRETKILDLAQKQITRAIGTVNELERAISAAAEGKSEDAEKSIERLFLEEKEVDTLRRSVFEELAKGSLPSKPREDLMHLVKRLDVLADHVKDSARNVKLLLKANVPHDIWRSNVTMVKDLRECALALYASLEMLGKDAAKAHEISQKVDETEDRVDDDYVATKALFIKHAQELDAATVMILKDLIDFMEQVADTCADTADYIRVLAVGEEQT